MFLREWEKKKLSKLSDLPENVSGASVEKWEFQRWESLLSFVLSMTSVCHHINGPSFSLALSHNSECLNVLICRWVINYLPGYTRDDVLPSGRCCRLGSACWLGAAEFLLHVYITGVTAVSRESSWERVEALFWTLLPPNSRKHSACAFALQQFWTMMDCFNKKKISRGQLFTFLCKKTAFEFFHSMLHWLSNSLDLK